MENTSKSVAVSSTSAPNGAGAGPSSSNSNQQQPRPPPKPFVYCSTNIRYGAADQNEEDVPKPSAATEMLFRVMRKSVDRLDGERDELKTVDNLLKQTLKDVEKEIGINGSMLDFAKRAWDFQIGIEDDEDSDFDGWSFGQKEGVGLAILEGMIMKEADKMLGLGEFKKEESGSGSGGGGDGVVPVAAEGEKEAGAEGGGITDFKTEYVLSDLIDA